MRNNQVKKLVILAFITALSVVLGNFLKIPTPTGFLTLLDAGIYFTAFYFGRKEAAIVGGLSGFLIDMIAGYPFRDSLLALRARNATLAWSWPQWLWSVAMPSLVVS